MPAEWEPHTGTWLTWPRREGISFPDIFDRIPPVIAAMVRALSEGEGVFINVWDAAMRARFWLNTVPSMTASNFSIIAPTNRGAAIMGRCL
jgi:agmatine/peptidylarginine deiminase